MNHNRVPQLLLEQYLLDELKPAKKAELERLIAHSPELQTELDALKANNKTILELYPPTQIVATIKERAKERANMISTNRFQIILPKIGMALMIPLMVFASYRFIRSTSTPIHNINPMSKHHEHINIKGEYGIKVIRKDGNHQRVLSSNAIAHEGDLIQLKYITRSGKFGLLLSLDGNGEVTVHIPADGTSNLKGKRQGVAPRSYELDDAPDFERFFMITSNNPIDIDLVKSSLKELKDPKKDQLKLDGLTEQYHFLLKKATKGE